MSRASAVTSSRPAQGEVAGRPGEPKAFGRGTYPFRVLGETGQGAPTDAGLPEVGPEPGFASTGAYYAADVRQVPHLSPRLALYAELEGGAYQVDAAPPDGALFLSGSLDAAARAAKRAAGPAVAVIVLVVFAALVSPVLARESRVPSTGPSSLNLSRYVAPGQAAPAGDVPVIDARSEAPALEPPQPAPPPAAAPSGPYDIVGAPSLSVAQIEHVLAQYGSPAAGSGQALYDLGVRYGIDPAYALAFFVHESGCGTKGIARATKSLGNIRWTPGYEQEGGFRKYPTWEAGMEDWYKLITELYIGEWGLRTVDRIIPVYAPWGDGNNPPAYIATVKKLVDSWRGK